MTGKRIHLADDRSSARAYSRAVITTGGRTIWLAGQTASATGEFDSQVREVFTKLDATIKSAGGAGLRDMVTMTVFINDPRLGDRFTELRKETFGENFPASALITVSGFARPGILIEIQGVAVTQDGST
ncbi:MAG: RidA family protein [Burkholderiales bacterium]|nr:RidA family protein [Burkholderiales bacterium]